LQDVCDARAQQLSLACAGACKHQDWPIYLVNGSALLVIELFVSNRKVIHSSILHCLAFRGMIEILLKGGLRHGVG
jgi:hypothetical protein